MSLENQLETLNINIVNLIEVTKNLMALREEAIGTVQATAATTSAAPKRGRKSAAEKAEEAAEDATADTTEDAAEERVEQPEQPEALNEPAADTLSEVVKEFVGLGGDNKEERSKITTIIKEIFGKVKATKRSEVPADKEAAVEKAIRTKMEEYQAAQDDTGSDEELL